MPVNYLLAASNTLSDRRNTLAYALKVQRFGERETERERDRERERERERVRTTLRASLSVTFRQTLPDLVTPLKGHLIFVSA